MFITILKLILSDALNIFFNNSVNKKKLFFLNYLKLLNYLFAKTQNLSGIANNWDKLCNLLKYRIIMLKYNPYN